MLSLIFLTVLGWLLYKAFFPGVALYYGEVPTDDEDLQSNHGGMVGHCQEDDPFFDPFLDDPLNPANPLNSMFKDRDYWERWESDYNRYLPDSPFHPDYRSKRDPFGDW